MTLFPCDSVVMAQAPLPAATVAKVLVLTCSDPPGETTHWTGRAMAETVGISLRAVQRIWQANRLQPHRMVLSIDEKSQIQALDRRGLRPRP